MTTLGCATLPPADLLLVGGRVHTLDPARPDATAIAVRGGRIAAVGSDAELRAYAGGGTRVIELGGATVVPGLGDAHAHLESLGRTMEIVDLRGTRSADEAAARVRDAAARQGGDGWILGRGWDQNDWPGAEFPDRAALDAAAPGRAVALDRVDGHALWVSSEALRRAGVTRDTPDPDGGRILRDADGAPTGVLVDAAETLVTRAIPPPDPATRERRIRAAVARAAALGLTQVHDMGVDEGGAAIFRRLAAAGELPIRVYALATPDEAEALVEREPEHGEWFARRAIKLFADGALGSRGAALIEPYADEPGNRGLVQLPRERLVALCRRALENGWQIGVHAIGDQGNRMVLDAYEEAAAGRIDHRFRLEHAQVLHPDDVPRAARLGVIASMQPTHATSDMPWAEARLGPGRLAGAYAWRTLLAAGVPLAFGSDFPVEEPDPLLGLYAAVTRQDLAGHPEGGWLPDQRLTAVEALRAFSAGAAYAAFQEDVRGRIAPGYWADLTVLDRDVLAVPPRELPRARAVYTIVGGRITHQAR